jgi:hypothetical protein
MNPENALAEAIEPLIDSVIDIEKRLDSLQLQPGKDGKDGKDAEPVDPAVVAEKLKSDESFIEAVTPALEVDLDEVTERIKADDGFIASLRGADGINGVDGVAGRDADPLLVADQLKSDPEFLATLIPQLQAERWESKIFREGSLVEHYNGRTYKSVCDTTEEPGDSAH